MYLIFIKFSLVQTQIVFIVLRQEVFLNIAFWSGVSGKCATSGNMLAVGTMASLMYSLKTMFVQYDIYSKPIEEIFEGKKNDNIIKDEISYYQNVGIDELLNKLKLNSVNEQMVYGHVKNIKDTGIFYLPSSKKVRNGLDDQSTSYLAKDLPRTLEKISDVSFIDNLNGKIRLSKKTLDEADVIVINLCQGINDVDYILSNEKLKSKAVFLVGKYDSESNENIMTIRKKYNIPKQMIGVVPYNIHFHDAIIEGNVVDFIKKSMYSRRSDGNFEFINELYKSTNMILQRAGFSEAS